MNEIHQMLFGEQPGEPEEPDIPQLRKRPPTDPNIMGHSVIDEMKERQDKRIYRLMSQVRIKIMKENAEKAKKGL